MLDRCYALASSERKMATAVMHHGKTCSTIRELRDRVAEHYGKEAVQLTFYLPKRQSTAEEPPSAQAGYKIDLDDE